MTGWTSKKLNPLFSFMQKKLMFMCLVCMVLFAPENYLNEIVSGEIWLWVRSEFCCFLFLSLLIPSLACAWIIPSLSFAHKCFSALYTLYSVHKLDFFLSLCLIDSWTTKTAFFRRRGKERETFHASFELASSSFVIIIIIIIQFIPSKDVDFSTPSV